MTPTRGSWTGTSTWTPVARELVDVRRGQHNRLGFAVQLGTVRFLGTFLPDPADVPWAVAAHLAAQLDIADPGVLKQYATSDGTNRLHAGEIQRVDLGEDAGGSVERRLGACSFGSGQPRVSRNTLVVVAACSAHTCLLYTSDAADDLLCVDLGGRRIIKKKKTKQEI